MTRMTRSGLAAALALLVSGGVAQAAPTIQLNPTSGDYVAGDIVTFTLNMDFSGPDDITLGGGMDIMWDSAMLGLVSWNPVSFGDPGFANPGTINEGDIDGFAFGDFGGLTGPADVATISFELLAAGMTSIMMDDDSDGAAGPFVSALTFAEQDVNFIGADLNIAGGAVPVPAALWLFVGGLGALFGFGRKKTA